MKYAIFADLHLSAEPRTVTEEVLDWAIATAVAAGAEAIVGAGDLLNCGSIIAARRLKAKLVESGLRFFLTPGNAELRTPAESAEVAKLLATPQQWQQLLLLDSSQAHLSSASRDLLDTCTGAGLLAVTHRPLESLPTQDQEILTQAAKRGVIRQLIAAHLHLDSVTGFCRTIRGLDPDKIAGGVPAFVIYDSEHGTIEEFPYARAEAAEWPHAERQAFLDCLGIACMREPGEALIFARENKIRVCELRVGGTDHCQVELERWREAVPDGRLSFHLPDLQHQDEDNTRLSEAVELAIALGCVRTTFHFPRATPAQMQSPVFRSRLKSKTIRLLAPLAQAGIAIGLENLHTYPNRERTYGCNLEECQSWLEELAPELPNLGFHFDLGHARNNYPFSSTENVADYFSRLGRVTNGIHLHQVSVLPSGEMQNHRPIKEIFGKLIPLSSLFLAWKSRQIPREVPIILEIRGGAVESWQLIADYLRAGASQSR